MLKTLAGCALLAASTLTVNTVSADAMSDAKDFVEKYSSKQDSWDGPTTGPKAQTNKSIVVLAADLKNGGILGVTNGIEAAAKELNWTVRVLDGTGSVSGRTSAFGQALALKPDGIVINGFDAVEQKPGMESATSAGIPMVSWHAASDVGPVEEVGIFANVTTNAMGRIQSGCTLGVYGRRR